MLASSRVFGSLLMASPKMHKCLVHNNASSWKIMAALIMERPPVIVQQFNALEKAYLELLREFEVENSLLCDHELRVREEEQKRKSKKGGAPIRSQLAEDLVKIYKTELADFQKQYPYKPNMNLKPDDPERYLDHSLTLIVHQQLGDKLHWCLPQAENVQGETLRQTAERAAVEYFGDNSKITFIGNAPVAFYKYKLPVKVQEETGKYGVKVFLMKSRCSSGQLKLNAKIGTEMIWATYDELFERFPSPMRKQLRPAFFRPTKPDFTRFLDSIGEMEEFRKRELITN